MTAGDGSGRRRPLVTAFQRFFRLEAAGGILLIAAAALALAWANSPLAASYRELWHTELSLEVGGVGLSKSLEVWINEGLMTLFFFLVGLEIKRELLVGELSTPRKAVLPLVAAAGGMVVPAAVYLALAGAEAPSGWGIPVATDIAFALGILALLGRRAPTGLKVFLTALAIADDLGAVLVIALFYTAQVSVGALAAAGACVAALVAANRAGVRATSVYVVLGLLLWLAALKSGVHATVAGVVLAATIPARSRLDADDFLEKARSSLDRVETEELTREASPLLSAVQHEALYGLEVVAQETVSPLARMEHALLPWVTFAVMPLFALANAGVRVGPGLGSALTSPVTLGVAAGLVVGKQAGVFAATWALVRSGAARLPEGMGWRQVYGVACLCGIGFTMSIFIATLAFADAAAVEAAKVGILVASLVSALLGWWVLRGTGPRPADPRDAHDR